MDTISIVLWTIAFLSIAYFVLSKYINAWIGKRKQLSHLRNHLRRLEKRKEDLISLSSWADDRGDTREARTIDKDLEVVNSEIEEVHTKIAVVSQTSIWHPGYLPF